MRIAANGTPGDDVRVTIRRSRDGYAWNGSAVVPFVVADIATYGLTATDPDAIGEYAFDTDVVAAGLPTDESYYASFFRIADTGVGLQRSDAPAFNQRNFVLGELPADPGATVTGDNVASYEQRIAQIDTAISNLLANPRPNYSVNGVRMDYGDLLEKLQSLRASMVKAANSLPAEGWDAFQNDVSMFGEDFTQYVGNP